MINTKPGLDQEKEDFMQSNETPLALDFAFEIPEEVEIESKTQVGDCVTWGVGGSDDD